MGSRYNATGVPTPVRNGFSWTKSATVVAIDSPAPTGFSYCDPPLRFEVTKLPGLEGPMPSRMFTGHIPAGTPPSGQGEMYFHYWLVESEHNVKEDPVLLWYNGGPGASSLFGLLQELGPLLLNDASYLTLCGAGH